MKQENIKNNKTEKDDVLTVEEIRDVELSDVEILLDIFGEDFYLGLQSMADTVGKIHALSLLGIDEKDALDYLLQLAILEHDKVVSLDLDKKEKVATEKTQVW